MTTLPPMGPLPESFDSFPALRRDARAYALAYGQQVAAAKDQEIARLEAERDALRARVAPCLWIRDFDDGSFDTACGDKHQFTEGDITDNGHHFCPYCGGRIIDANDEHPDAAPQHEGEK